jgi:hypothetical protein
MPVVNGIEFTAAQMPDGGYLGEVTVDGVVYTRWEAMLVSMVNELNYVKAPGAYSETTASVSSDGTFGLALKAAATMPPGHYKMYSKAAPTTYMIVTLADGIVAQASIAVTALARSGSGTAADWIIVPLTNDARKQVSQKTGPYTVISSDLGSIIECSGSTFTLSLTPASSLGDGFSVEIKNSEGTSSTNQVTIDPNGSELIDDRSTVILKPGQWIRLVARSNNWIIAGGNSWRIRQTVGVGAAGWKARATGGAATGTYESSTNKINLDTLDFDASSIELAGLHYPKPDSYLGGDIVIKTRILKAAGAGGGLTWGYGARCFTSLDALDAALSSVTTSSLAIASTAVDQMIELPDITVTPAGTPAGGKMIYIEGSRRATASGDTLASDARLIETVIEFDAGYMGSDA